MPLARLKLTLRRPQSRSGTRGRLWRSSKVLHDLPHCSRFTEVPKKVEQHIKPKGTRWIPVRLAAIPHRWRVNPSVGNTAGDAPVKLLAYQSSAALLQSDPSNQVCKQSSPNTHLTWAAWYIKTPSATQRSTLQDLSCPLILNQDFGTGCKTHFFVQVPSPACRVVGAYNYPDFHQDHPDNEPSTASCLHRSITPYRAHQDPGSLELMLAITSSRAHQIAGSREDDDE
ncbi:hypothetical protein B0H17DRAFT_1150163 [Mycena rosella]|uniref:Uncharacterized protein n=1 Tax=Mycena rosella TaxID=1033263 RepID=A0AAD7FM22_MYCRO|nr:hypothetical protein B0H17DRAFT_1150163 [Mycena rosella]